MNTFCALASLCLFLGTILHADRYAARFAPPPGKILIFAGQDNESTGGTLRHRDGYVDNVGIPGALPITSISPRGGPTSMAEPLPPEKSMV